MAYPKLNPHFTPSARVEEISSETSHYLLSIPSGKAGIYRLAQLDDYAKLPRRRFLHRNPVSLSLSARTSSNSIPGTWGFGLWNDPFGMSIGYGGKPFRVPALPNAIWYFGASKESYLSFSDGPANGFLTQVFRSPRFHPLLIMAGLALPFSRKAARKLMDRIVSEAGIPLSVDATQWHRYKLDWSQTRVSYEVDEAHLFESVVRPVPPLGLVIWIDNQFAKFTPEGKIGFGVLENPKPAWLEIKDIELA